MVFWAYRGWLARHTVVGAHIEKQFERDQLAKTRVNWQLPNLGKLLLLLFVLLMYVFASML